MPAPGPSPVTRQFLSFSVVGTIGFVVDTATLYFAMGQLGLGLYSGRVISYLVAATSTWALNRRFTFRQQRSTNRLGEWGRFLGANAFGGLVNYGVYAALVTLNDTASAHPVIGVAAGSVAGLLVNFSASRYVVFTGRAPRG
jgi:putative flippase GtrA